MKHIKFSVVERVKITIILTIVLFVLNYLCLICLINIYLQQALKFLGDLWSRFAILNLCIPGDSGFG